MRFRARPALFLGALLAAGTSACQPPSDVLVEPEKYAPAMEPDGRFRVTSGVTPAEPRGFTPDDRLVFRTRDLPPFGSGWVLVSVPTDSGYVREEAAVYRRALVDEIGALAQLDDRRVLATWKEPLALVQGCPEPAPPVPVPVAFTLHALPPQDGPALSNIPTRFVSAGVTAPRSEPGPPNAVGNVRVRATPAAREITARGGNPYGPVLVPGGHDVIYADGERIWQASMADTSQPATFVAAGAYPALSAGGGQLAYARPVGVDSTVEVIIVPAGLGVCVQEHVEITATGWEVIVRDLSTGTEQILGEGLEPAFDPLSARLLVRGPSELEWIDLATGMRTSIRPTTNAFAPFTALDGSILTFAVAEGGVPSVYFLPIQR